MPRPPEVVAAELAALHARNAAALLLLPRPVREAIALLVEFAQASSTQGADDGR